MANQRVSDKANQQMDEPNIEHPPSIFIPTNGIRLHVIRTGGQKPPLIALHGRTGSGLLWTRTARLLKPYFDVIMPDLRGHGQSEAPTDGYDHDTMSRDILDVMDALGVKRAVLMDGSMGAALAPRIAAQHPDRVEKLVLHLSCWTSTAQLSPDYLENKIARKRAQYRAWNATPLPDLVAQVRVFSSGWTDEDIALAAQAWHQVHENAAQTFGHDLSEAEWHAPVKQVSCPILALMGHAETNYAATRDFCENELPVCTFAPLKGGHTAMFEDFENYVYHLQTFLDIV